MRIEDVLRDRLDISPYLVHLTKDQGDVPARDIVRKIFDEGELIPARPMGWAASTITEKGWNVATENQRVVCFTEVPPTEIRWMAQDIAGRSEQFRPYGLVFDKQRMRLRDVNPVWYLDATQGHDWVLAKAMDELLGAAVTEEQAFCAHHGARLFPFVESMGTGDDWQREFWWEREWRHRGNFALGIELVGLLAPEAEHDLFADLPLVGTHLADPFWDDHERILSGMRVIEGSGLSPLPPPRGARSGAPLVVPSDAAHATPPSRVACSCARGIIASATRRQPSSAGCLRRSRTPTALSLSILWTATTSYAGHERHELRHRVAVRGRRVQLVTQARALGSTTARVAPRRHRPRGQSTRQRRPL